MGAGFFPLVLGIVLVVLGAAIIGRSLVGIRDTIDALNWRGLSFLLGAICLFGFVLKPLGPVIALLTWCCSADWPIASSDGSKASRWGSFWLFWRPVCSSLP